MSTTHVQSTATARLDRFDFVNWSLYQAPKGDQRIGGSRVALVLIRLAMYADSDGKAYPSVKTLANGLGGFYEWDVKNALTLLRKHGFISRSPSSSRGRPVTWQFDVARIDADLAEVVGYPTRSVRAEVAGYPTTYVAGEIAGEIAGDVVGYPAAKGTEVNSGEVGTHELGTASRRVAARRCLLHDSWEHSEPCSDCARDRRAFERGRQGRAPGTMSERIIDCGVDQHRWLADGTCVNCETRRDIGPIARGA